MANLPEVDQFDTGVYQLETTDPALGGANGIMNNPPKSLVNRTRFLLNRILDGVLSFVNDSGAANAIVAGYPQPIAALVDGMEVSVRIGFANTTATTLKLANTGGAVIPVLPIYGGDHVALTGSEFPVGSVATFKYSSVLNASNGGAWVVKSVTGGFARIPTAPSGDSSTKAANMAAVFNATDGMSTVSVSGATDVTLTAAQYGSAIVKLTGTPTAPINLILPAGITGQWIVNNQQGGANNITIKPSGGTGVVLPQNSSPTIVTSDGSVAQFASAQAGQLAFAIVPIPSFAGTTMTVPGGYTPGGIFIEKNGNLLEPADYSATASPTITLTKAATTSDVFNVYRFTSFNVANAVLKSGDTMAGPLNLAGGDTAVTTAQFDNSTAPATTAFVKRQGVQASGISVVSATATLSNAVIGGTVIGNSASAIAQTLPAASSVPAGARIEFLNINTGTLTVQRAGSDTLNPNNSTVTSLALGNGDTLTLESNGTNAWYAVSGSVALGYSAAFLATLTANGYLKLPSGRILQHGTTSCAASADTNVTLPITFPNAFDDVLTSADYTPNSGAIYKTASGVISTSQFAVRHDSASAINVHWFAIGR
jgi:hypothetical protein